MTAVIVLTILAGTLLFTRLSEGAQESPVGAGSAQALAANNPTTVQRGIPGYADAIAQHRENPTTGGSTEVGGRPDIGEALGTGQSLTSSSMSSTNVDPESQLVDQIEIEQLIVSTGFAGSDLDDPIGPVIETTTFALGSQGSISEIAGEVDINAGNRTVGSVPNSGEDGVARTAEGSAALSDGGPESTGGFGVVNDANDTTPFDESNDVDEDDEPVAEDEPVVENIETEDDSTSEDSEIGSGESRSDDNASRKGQGSNKDNTPSDEVGTDDEESADEVDDEPGAKNVETEDDSTSEDSNTGSGKPKSGAEADDKGQGKKRGGSSDTESDTEDEKLDDKQVTDRETVVDESTPDEEPEDDSKFDTPGKGFGLSRADDIGKGSKKNNAPSDQADEGDEDPGAADEIDVVDREASSGQ
jgi:hypothetical protein